MNGASMLMHGASWRGGHFGLHPLTMRAHRGIPRLAAAQAALGRKAASTA
jgi:hypothetical protein